MRVLFYSNLFPSSREPTRGVFNLQRIDALAKHCEVRVICPVALQNRLRTPSELFETPVERHGLLEIEYPTFVPLVRVAPRLNPLFLDTVTRRTVNRIRKQFPFDVVLASWGYPDAVAALRIARRYRCPQVTQLLGSDLNIVAQMPEVKTLIIDTLSQSARVLTMSQAMADSVEQMGVARSRIVVQHNGVDPARFQVRSRMDNRARLGLPADTRIILYVGNLAQVKGPDVLVSAYARLTTITQHKTLLVFVGDGPMRPSLEATVRQFRLQERVRFVGRRLYAEIPEWIGAADLLCLPSHAEGCPNVVLEAFASGRPVVASAVGAVPDLVTPTRGRVVPAGKVEQLTGALNEALSITWDAASIRASIADQTWEAVGRRYFEILSEAVQGHANASTMTEGSCR